MKKTVIFLVIFSFISRISGFLREVFMAWRFGASIQTDTYIAALTVPVMVIGFVTVGLNNSLIPVLSAAEKKGQRETFFNRLLSVLVVIAIVIMILIIVLARPLNLLIVRGFTPEQIDRVIYYSRMMSVIALFQIISFAFMGYLQQNNRFYAAATASIPMNFGTIIGAILSPTSSSIIIMVIGTIFGYFLHLLWVLFPVIRLKFPFKFDFDLSDEHFKMVLLIIIPVMVTLSVGQINGIVNRALASSLEEGSISLLNFAQKVNGLFYQTIVVTLSTVLFTRQAKLSSDQDWKGIFNLTRDNLSNVMMIIVPLMLGVMFLSTELMQIIFQRGAFTAEDSIKGGMVLLFYSPTLIAMSTNEILSKMFFSLHQSKKPMIATLTNLSLNIILNLLVYKKYGINGLAAATTVATLIGILVLSLMARKQFRQEGVRFWTPSYLKYLIAGGMMIAVLLGLKMVPQFRDLPVLIYTMLCGMIGAVVYFVGLYLTKTPEFLNALGIVRTRLKRS